MNVYVEYAIIDNFVMDYLLLRLAVIGVADKSSVKKRTLGALFGTVFAVYLPIWNVPPFFSVVLKIAVSALMVFFAFEAETFVGYLKRYALFLFFTVILGGMIYAFAGIVGAEYDAISNIFSGGVPLFVVLLIGAGAYFVAYSVFSALFRKRTVVPFVRRCVLFLNGRKIIVNGFIDSGNGVLTEDLNGVCVAGKRLVPKLKSCGLFCSKSAETVCFGTVGGSSFMTVYSLEKIIVINGKKKNTIYKAKIGIPDNPVDFGDDYTLVLPAVYAYV